ncbi:hypothetical protein B0H11DRAFT_2218134 [Mycena galericulata]|nr:hypothetical protein B0H11DRAFT_2218134 [Mycena galericulata]
MTEGDGAAGRKNKSSRGKRSPGFRSHKGKALALAAFNDMLAFPGMVLVIAVHNRAYSAAFRRSYFSLGLRVA